jgi:hypothetical protein
MNEDAAARHRSGLLAILSVAPSRLMNGASRAPLTNHADLTQCVLYEWCYFSLQPEREVDLPSRIRHQRAFDANRRNYAETAASHRAVTIGAFETAPDVGTNALGRFRAAVGHGICRAVSGAPPPLETPGAAAPRCRAERPSPAVAAPGSCLPGAPIVWDTRP